MSQGDAWPVKYPWRLLPRGGTRPYRPPERGDWLRNPPRGPQGGYLDRAGNEWVPHVHPSSQEPQFHWDVQHSNGSHSNIRPDGEIHHGDDNFP